MSAHHAIRQEQGQRWRRASSNGLVRLGFSHFWLLTAILGGILALLVLVLFVHAVNVG